QRSSLILRDLTTCFSSVADFSVASCFFFSWSFSLAGSRGLALAFESGFPLPPGGLGSCAARAPSNVEIISNPLASQVVTRFIISGLAEEVRTGIEEASVSPTLMGFDCKKPVGATTGGRPTHAFRTFEARPIVYA